MQLKNISIKAALSLATCGLLNVTAYADSPVLLDDKSSAATEVKASNMLYAEDDRVVVDEIVVSAKREINDAEFIKATITVDVMSGPSPNGLPAINKPDESDTYTSPSGSVIKPSGDSEQTFQFRDSRYALALEWIKPLSRLLSTTSGISLSTEYDYSSLGASSNWKKDSEDRLTTFSAGLAGNYDYIKPVGGAPQGLTSTENDPETGSRSKTEADLLLGVTQVVTRHTLLQANYVANVKSGYLTDPYKLVVLLDNDDLAPVNNQPYYYEKRPDSRLSHIVYFNLIQNIHDNVLKFSYRYFDDDWGVYSHTAEARYMLNLSEKTSVQFKYRYYTQHRAYFYHYYLVDGDYAGVDRRDVVSSPNDLKYVSADYRLGNLQSQTVGVDFSKKFTVKDARVNFRVDRIISSDKDKRFESVRAWVVQLAGKINF